MHVANFTPDTIEWMHVGVTGKLKPGDIAEFDDARGKHILNKWGARGLLRVTYEDRDNEDEKRREAMKIYREFCMKQISNFNQHNESLKNENKPYVYPSPYIEEKAEELGIPLVGPWKIKPAVSEEAKKEMESIKTEFSALKDMMSKMMAEFNNVSKQRDEALIAQFQSLEKTDFRAWVEFNLAKIRTWPSHIQALVQAKWKELCGHEVYPLTS